MWGYTVAIPINTCPPGSLAKIHINVEFQPVGGNPLFASSGTIKMKSPEEKYTSSTRQEFGQPSSQPTNLVVGTTPPPKPMLPEQVYRATPAQLQFQGGRN
jgi:hypothetical protein